MAKLKFTLTITIVANMAKIVILAISAMAIGLINMAILGIQLKSIKKLAQWCFIHTYRIFRSYIIKSFVILSFSQLLYNVKMPILRG